MATSITHHIYCILFYPNTATLAACLHLLCEDITFTSYLPLLSKVPSVPSDNNCLSWTGNGTVIIQVMA